MTGTAHRRATSAPDAGVEALLFQFRDMGKIRRLAIECEDVDALSVFLRLHPWAGTALTLTVVEAIRQSEHGSTIRVGGHAGNGELILSASGVVASDSDDEDAGASYCKFRQLPIPGARKTKGYVEVAPGKFAWRTGPKDTRYRTAEVLKIISRHVEEVCERRGEIIGKAGNSKIGQRRLNAQLKAHALDTYAIAQACFDWSGDYLSSWLKQHGLPSAHSLVRGQRIAIGQRLLANGVDEDTVALQVGVSSRSYLRQLLAQHGADASQ